MEEEKPEPTVYIDETDGKYQLIRNGRPFYIKGGAAASGFLEELKEAGGNTARIYDTINLKRSLDKAEELGLAVVVDLPMPKFNTDPQFYENQELFNTMFSSIRKTVLKYKDHPALLYWNLGNELYYPYFYNTTRFYSNYNSLIDLIHELDPNHPVSTTTIGANKLRVISITLRSPQLDFISFNSFGSLSSFYRKLLPIEPVWNGPHVISEWGVNGPWEVPITIWGAPVEETSTKKAEQVSQRHSEYIEPLKDYNSLGSFVFYWGQKNEVTPSWYSLFHPSGAKSQTVFELKQMWTEQEKEEFPGPELEYLLLDDQGALDNIAVRPSSVLKAEVVLPKNKEQSLDYAWEIRPESWYHFHISEKIGSMRTEDKQVIFNAPKEEGPYRLFVYLTNGTEYFATANIPFFVLNPEHEE